MSKSRIGVGFVGLSATRGWAARGHLPALALLPEFEIRGLVGATPESAAAAGEKYGIAYTTNQIGDLLARPDIDLVVITVVVPSHRAAIEAALRAGKAVFCEWPLACNLREAEEIAALARTLSVPCFVNMQASHSPALKFISDLLAQGYVGRVLSTSVLGTGGSPWGLDMIDNNQRVYQDKRNGATVLTIPIGHLLDSLIRLFGTLDEPRTTLAVRKLSVGVRGTDERLDVSSPDQVCISGRFSSGPIGSIHYRTGAQTSAGLHWEINGTEGCLVVKAPTGHVQYGDVTIDGIGNGAKEFERLEIPERYWPVSGPRTGLGYTVAVAYDMICKDLRNGTSNACGIDDALVLHKNLQAIELAA